ncbi:hypothetical protein [Rugosimonospora acidiphila]
MDRREERAAARGGPATRTVRRRTVRRITGAGDPAPVRRTVPRSARSTPGADGALTDGTLTDVSPTDVSPTDVSLTDATLATGELGSAMWGDLELGGDVTLPDDPGGDRLAGDDLAQDGLAGDDRAPDDLVPDGPSPDDPLPNAPGDGSAPGDAEGASGGRPPTTTGRVTVPRPRPSPRRRPRPSPATTSGGAAVRDPGAAPGVGSDAGAASAATRSQTGRAGGGDPDSGDPDSEDPDSGYAGGGGASWRPRLLAGALVVLLVAGLGAAGLLARGWYHQRQLDDARQAALAAGRQTTVNFVSISASTVDRDLKRIADGATGQFKDEFAQDTAQVRAAVVANKVKSTGTVLRAAVVSANLRSAVVLIAIDATVKNTSAPDGRLSHYRIQVNLSRGASGRWLVAQLQFVG